MRVDRSLSLATAAVFLISLAVYLRTLAPAVGPTDCGELTTAAWVLGNAHPPGFPLYLLSTHAVMKLLPIGSIAWRANFSSALFAALAAAAVAAIAGQIARRSTDAMRWSDGIIGAAAGLTLAFSRTLWNYATVAEVYALNTFLVAMAWMFAMSWSRRKTALRLAATFFFLGLGLGVHYVISGICALGAMVFVLDNERLRFFKGRQFAITILATLAGLLVYLYLPLAARRQPAFNWGDPVNAARSSRT